MHCFANLVGILSSNPSYRYHVLRYHQALYISSHTPVVAGTVRRACWVFMRSTTTLSNNDTGPFFRGHWSFIKGYPMFRAEDVVNGASEQSLMINLCRACQHCKRPAMLGPLSARSELFD